MNISALNYGEVVNPETGKALAGGGDIAFNIAKDVNWNKVVNLEINKNVDESNWSPEKFPSGQ